MDTPNPKVDAPKWVQINFNIPAIIFMVLLLAFVGIGTWFNGYAAGKIFVFRDLDHQTKILKKEFVDLEWQYEGMRQWLATLDAQQVKIGLPPIASVVNQAIVARADSMLTVIDSLQARIQKLQSGAKP